MDFIEIMQGFSFEKTVTICSLLIALISLFVSFIDVYRDKPKLIFNMYLGEVYHSLPDPSDKSDCIYFSFSNIGRRPITITHIGGSRTHGLLNHIIYSVLRIFLYEEHDYLKKYSKTNFVFSGPEVTRLTHSFNGKIILKEGDMESFAIDIKNLAALNSVTLDVCDYHIIDTSSKKYFLSRKQFKKFKRQVAALRKKLV